MRWLACVLAVAACAPTRSELRAPVDRELARRLGGPVATQLTSEIAALLGKPLTRDSAVKIALANNARLSAALAELGIAGGDLASALAPGPLDIDVLARFGSGGAHEVEIDAIQNVIGLITAPRERAAARAELAAARAAATATALGIAARAEIAFDDVIAAQQELELRRTAFDAADAAAVVRERMHAAGNATDLEQALDRDAREQARIDLARAEADIEIRREQLNAVLGLSGDQTKWTAAGTLGELPAAPPALDDLEQAAVAASLDLAAGRARVASAENTVGAERVRAWLPELGVGVSAIEQGEGIEVGPALRIGIPLFDQRSGPRARARATLAKAESELTAAAVELRANARAARIAALAAYQEARHLRDIVLPLRQQIVDQTLLHYNAMNATTFDLIAAHRSLADAGHQYLDALHRYWNAMSRIGAMRRGVDLGATQMPGRSTSAPSAPELH